MGRRTATGGITEHRGRIRLNFRYRGRRLRPTLELEFNERNRRAASRLLEEIEQKIRHGVFALADYFPEFCPAAGQNGPAGEPATFGHYADLWEKSLTLKAPATRQDYRKILERVWRPRLADKAVAAIRYSDLVEIIGELGMAAKTLNNNLIPLRGVFEFAKRDRAIADNPAAGIENAPVQRQPPDPFTLDEVDAILDDLIDHEPEQVHNYFAAAFFAGFRPSEQIALVWFDIDFLRREARVQRAIVRNLAKPSTKTYLVRDVELVDRAWDAIEAQRAYTQLAGAEVFKDPATGQRWAGLQRQHKLWGRCLRRLGLRYREPYQTRHTFATLGLMAGNNPAWVARQLGHVNAQMVFKVYAKWIDGADKSRERDRFNAALGHTRATLGERREVSASAGTIVLAEREGFEPSIQVLARMLP